MPPKTQPKGPKIVVDKTFGMKNKKGGAAQKQINAIKQQQASGGSPDDKRKAALKDQIAKDKLAAEKAAKEAAELFKPVQIQKVPFGVDPKSVLCQFFKAGNCEKGKKCKFSHDLAIERKAEKKSLYGEGEAGEGGKDGEGKNGEEDVRIKDDMADWDQEKLNAVVLSKHGNAKTTTDKVCKFFVEAVENGKYGWFWTCPNGGSECKYKHTLPPGFVLKTKEQRAAEKAAMDKQNANALTLEDFLESERHKLTGKLTPVTPETFAKWKKERMDKKAAEDEARRRKEDSGRAMFEAGDYELSEEEEDDEEEGDDAWNMDALRVETERAREAKEQERMAKQFGYTYVEQEQPPPDEDDGEDSGEGSSSGVHSNGVNGVTNGGS